MIEANNSEIDVGVLNRRIEVELRQSERPDTPALIPRVNPIPEFHHATLSALKLKLRRIPVIGALLMLLNRWQRRWRLAPRILALPYIGYGLRWLKSLALMHETRGRLQTAFHEITALDHRLRGDIALGASRLAELQGEVAGLQRDLGFTEQRLGTALEINTLHLKALRAEIAEEKKLIATNRSEILFQQRRLSTLLEQGAPRSVTVALPHEAAKPHTDALDSYYAAFEAAFRGAREEIKNRLRVYLDRLMPAAGQDLPVLDIGCGRGEWIELLREHGIAAYGIDLNSVFVAQGREDNLDLREAEALAHLRALPDASLYGLSGFHIIEHLELNVLISIIDEANRVLAPGGFILFETPNPENLIVGATTFWSDPTHHKPLPPSVSHFMVEHRGFIDAEIIYLHPTAEERKLPGSDETTQRLNQLLYGPQDYAIWARKA